MRSNMTANGGQIGGFMGVVYSMYDALVSINVPTDKAKAVIDAMEREMMDKVATKSDLDHVRELISKDFEVVNGRIDNLTHVLTVRLFLAAAATVPLIVAGQKLF
ncbi:MAG: hypothetical protein ABI616_01960 [Pseudomonadota bacterium]